MEREKGMRSSRDRESVGLISAEIYDAFDANVAEIEAAGCELVRNLGPWIVVRPDADGGGSAHISGPWSARELAAHFGVKKIRKQALAGATDD